MPMPDFEAAWNSHDSQRIAAMYTEDAVRWEPALPGRVITGRAEIEKSIAENQLKPMPHARLTVRTTIEGTDGTLILEWTWGGVHERDAPGWPASGERSELVGISVCEMEGDLIKQERVYWDTATVLAQAGVIS